MANLLTNLPYEQYDQKYGLPNGFLRAVAETESGFDPSQVSPAGAAGLFQFMPKTAQAYGVDVKDPMSSLNGAGHYYSDLVKQFGNIDAALAAYNWGPGNVAKKGLSNMPRETQNYIASVKKKLDRNQEYLNKGMIPPL